jgi:hypothetical protein
LPLKSSCRAFSMVGMNDIISDGFWHCQALFGQ